MTTGTERSSVLSGRRKEKARSERVAVERAMPVRQPLGMTDSSVYFMATTPNLELRDPGNHKMTKSWPVLRETDGATLVLKVKCQDLTLMCGVGTCN